MKYPSNRNRFTDNMEFSEAFPEPSSISDADNRLIVLRQELSKIRQQLNDSGRRANMGLSEQEYEKWRHKAIHARDMKFVQQKKLMKWIMEHRASRAVFAMDTKDPVAVLAEIVDMINDVRQRYRIPLSDQQQNLVALAEHITYNMQIQWVRTPPSLS